MRTILFTLLLMLLILHDAAAGNSARKPRSQRKATRNVIWFHPNRARVINGLALGPFNFQSFRRDSNLTVNGLNLELPGFAIFPLPVRESYITVNGLDVSPFRYGGITNGLSLAFSSSGYETRGGSLAAFNYVDGSMNGFQGGFLMTRSGALKGLQLAAFSFTGDGRGLIIGGYMCLNDTMRGLSLGGLNTATKHHGIQLGVINYAKELRGVQFGLINVAENCRRKFMPVLLISKRGNAAH